MDFEEKRRRLVESMEWNGSLKSRELKEAFLAVKRELFFTKDLVHASYVDSAFPIGYNQTISQPSTIAIMLELLGVGKGMKVLEVGGGSGYVLALLSKLVGERGAVFGIELVEELVERCRENLVKAGVRNAFVFYGDGREGLGGKAPFDRILISAACNKVPGKLVEQLSENGRIVAPLNRAFGQKMVVVEKKGGKVSEEFPYPGSFVFVPLR